MNIAIWSCNAFSKRLYQLLENTPIKVLAFLSPAPSATTFCSKPLMPPAEFKANKAFATLPIVIAAPHPILRSGMLYIDFEAIRQFKIMIQQIANEYLIPNALLHPAALIDMLPFRYAHKIVNFGLQGSGNTVFNHILQGIQKKKKARPSAALFFEQLCFEYTHIIHQVISDAIYAVGAEEIHVAPWKIGTSHFNGFINKETITIFCFQTRDHIIHSNYGYHILPTKKSMEELVTRNIKTFFIIRNPLDIILSNLNKLNEIDYDANQIKRPEVMFAVSHFVMKTLSYWHSLQLPMNELRYEALIQDPIQYIRNIMRTLKIFPSRRFAKKLWQATGFKELPAATKNHFWQGGEGKWKTYFNKDHLAFLKANKMSALLQIYNYPETLAEFNALTTDISVTTLSTYQSETFLQTLSNYEYLKNNFGFDNVDTLKFLRYLCGEHNCSKMDHLMVGCVNNEYTQRVEKALNNKFLKNVISAGAHPSYRII